MHVYEAFRALTAQAHGGCVTPARPTSECSARYAFTPYAIWSLPGEAVDLTGEYYLQPVHPLALRRSVETREGVSVAIAAGLEPGLWLDGVGGGSVAQSNAPVEFVEAPHRIGRTGP